MYGVIMAGIKFKPHNPEWDQWVAGVVILCVGIAGGKLIWLSLAFLVPLVWLHLFEWTSKD